MNGRAGSAGSFAPRGGISWFVYTCGVPLDAHYRWYAISAEDDPHVADADFGRSLGGCVPGEIIDGGAPSLLLGHRVGDTWALYVGGLRPKGVPVGRHREIRTALLGLAHAGGDLDRLLDVAGQALRGDLDEQVPVRWKDGRPLIADDLPWPPPKLEEPTEPETAPKDQQGPRDRPITLDLRASVGVPEDDREQVWTDLAAITASDLRDFPSKRALVVRAALMTSERLAVLRPWRALSGRIAQRTEWPDQPAALPVPAPKESKRRARALDPVGGQGVGAGLAGAEGGSPGGDGLAATRLELAARRRRAADRRAAGHRSPAGREPGSRAPGVPEPGIREPGIRASFLAGAAFGFGVAAAGFLLWLVITRGNRFGC